MHGLANWVFRGRRGSQAFHSAMEMSDKLLAQPAMSRQQACCTCRQAFPGPEEGTRAVHCRTSSQERPGPTAPTEHARCGSGSGSGSLQTSTAVVLEPKVRTTMTLPTYRHHGHAPSPRTIRDNDHCHRACTANSSPVLLFLPSRHLHDDATTTITS